MDDVLQRAVEIAKELERRKATSRMYDYEPYEYQKKFHNNNNSTYSLNVLPVNIS